MKFSLPTLYASWAAFGLLCLASCKGDSSASAAADQVAYNDYESLVGWAPNTESLTKEQAHSGKYSVKVGPNNEFGLGYSMQLNKIFDHKPHKLRISGWGYMTDTKATARLGFQLYDKAQGKELFGDGIDYVTAVRTPGKWVEIEKVVTLPVTVTGENEIRAFLYRGNAGSPAYIDDLRISEVKE